MFSEDYAPPSRAAESLRQNIQWTGQWAKECMYAQEIVFPEPSRVILTKEVLTEDAEKECHEDRRVDPDT